MKSRLLFVLILSTISLIGTPTTSATQSGQQRLGVNMHPVQDVYAPDTVSQQVQLARSIGASTVVIDIHWAWLDPNHCDWDETQLSRIDAFVGLLDGTGVDTVAFITETPCWASSDPNKDCPSGQYDWRYPPANPQDLAIFLTDLVARYKGDIKYWGIWGEPNTPYRWADPDAASYTALLQAAYPAIKAVDPNASVLSASLAPYDGSPGVPSVFEYLNQMYSAGAKGYFDILAYNPYTDGHDPTWYNPSFPAVSFSHSVPALRQIMLANGDTSPIWLTEVGWSTVTECVDCGATLPATEGEQAAYMAEAIEIAGAWNYVGAYIVYELVDMIMPPDDEQRLEYHWGLFRQDFTAKPAARQFANLALPYKQFLPLVLR